MSLVFDRNLAVDALVERDESFGAGDAADALNFVVEQFHQVLVVASVHFDEHVVRTGAEVALNNFFDFLEFGYNAAIHRAAFEFHTHIGASSITKSLCINMLSRAGDYLHVTHALNALMNG